MNEKKKNHSEFVVGFKLYPKPEIGQFEILPDDPYCVSLIDGIGGIWKLSYTPPASETGEDGMDLPLVPNPAKQLKEVMPLLENLFRRELNPCGRPGRPPEDTKQFVRELSRAADQVERSGKKITMANMTQAMGLTDKNSLRRKCRNHFSGQKPLEALKRAVRGRVAEKKSD